VFSFVVEKEFELKPLLELLERQTKQSSIILLNGELGSGKTTLVKYFCQHLDITESVSSPSFGLVNEYRTNSLSLFHFDLYRIKNIEELFEIGFEEYFNQDAICMIEWPEIALPIINKYKPIIQLNIDFIAPKRKFELRLIDN
jgi:tRNA threonylcarbamoyladenosine biosynthesis protein TsaE